MSSKEDPQAAAAEPVPADPALVDPALPTGPGVAQDGTQDPVSTAERLARDAGDRVAAVALLAHDLGADAARALRANLRAALDRVERVIDHHEQEGQ